MEKFCVCYTNGDIYEFDSLKKAFSYAMYQSTDEAETLTDDYDSMCEYIQEYVNDGLTPDVEVIVSSNWDYDHEHSFRHDFDYHR